MTLRNLKNKKGQSTVEFALILLFTFTFVFLYLQLALVFAVGNYFHYATFMSARAFMAAGPDQEDQRTRARETLIKMVKKSAGQAGIDRYPGLARASGGGDLSGADIGAHDRFVETDPNFSWLEGVRYTFRSRIFLIPLAGNASSNSMTLTSESWLGREPSFAECVDNMLAEDNFIIDNGC